MSRPPNRRERRFRNLIDRELQGRLPASHRQEVMEHLRANTQAREHYDHGITAFRALADDDIAPVELEQVEQWLFDGPDPVSAGGPRLQHETTARRWSLWGVMAGVTASLLLLVWVNNPPPELDEVVEAEGFTPRGGSILQRLSLEALCSPQASVGRHHALTNLRPGQQQGCPSDGILGFSYRVRAAEHAVDPPLSLSIFGVDHSSRIQYYAPTPVDPNAVTASVGTTQATPMTVDLAINHHPGNLRVFGLLSRQTPTISAIDQFAEHLESQAPAGFGEKPWHQRLDLPELAALCPNKDACASAELSLTVMEHRHD